MTTVPVYNLSNVKVGEIALPERIFGVEVKEHLLHAVVRWQLARRRAGTHKTKDRSEVAYSKKKLYRQKGTGNARHGSRRSPTMRGGGVALAVIPRDYSFKINRKERKAALCSALTLHVSQDTLKVVDSFALAQIKTKALASTLDTLEMGSNVLILDVDGNNELWLSARNLPRVDVLPPTGVNVYDLLNHDRLIITRQALDALEGVL